MLLRDDHARFASAGERVDGFDLIMQDGQRANDFLSSLPRSTEEFNVESRCLQGVPPPQYITNSREQDRPDVNIAGKTGVLDTQQTCRNEP